MWKLRYLEQIFFDNPCLPTLAFQGDEQREEKTKEEMQKNVLSIRGEDRRYWRVSLLLIQNSCSKEYEYDPEF